MSEASAPLAPPGPPAPNMNIMPDIVPDTSYVVPEEAIRQFHEQGFCILKNFLSEEELQFIDEVYAKFLSGEIKPEGKDLCDMSDTTGKRTFDQYSIVNAMLPTKYHAPLQNNVYERRAAGAVAQIYKGIAMKPDYDQLLCKKPKKTDAIFAWHQDMAYWPPTSMTPHTETATFSLAVDPTTIQNGCIKYIPGSHKGKELRRHVPVAKLTGKRDEAHAIAIQVDEAAETIVQAEVCRGDVTVHDEWVVHGSGGNYTDGTRRTYVLAYRNADAVARERALGFDHSHNTNFNWDKYHNWLDYAEPAAEPAAAKDA